jgi:hypothetical protein
MTETSWILQRDGMRLALLTAKDGELISMGKLGKSKFADIGDLEKFLGSKVEIEQPDEELTEELAVINGYPAKHSGAAAAETELDLPVYLRGKTEHAAGYYGVKFSHGWVTSYCPKLTTLTGNEHCGPFRTKLEMLNAISQKKRAIEI